MSTAFRFTCGHVGRVNVSWRARAHAFIRLAEIRYRDVVDKPQSCPDCKRGD